MSTPARAAASRDNARNSTGPSTPEGKAASSMNAVSHGLTSKTIVLPHEDPAEYNQVREGLIEAHRPANHNEEILVDHVAQCYWRLQRTYSVERAFLDNRITAAQEHSPETAPDTAIALLFIEPAEAARMRLVMRYLAAAERAHAKAVADLRKAQADRREREAQETRDQIMLEALAGYPAATPFEPEASPTATRTAADSPSGFVSYNSSEATPHPRTAAPKPDILARAA